jgi:hypothetical protein
MQGNSIQKDPGRAPMLYTSGSPVGVFLNEEQEHPSWVKMIDLLIKLKVKLIQLIQTSYNMQG